MGVVYKAEDTTLDRPVALKFLADQLLNEEEAKQRFLREAKAAAALHHPNVCPVHEIAEADGKTFLAMAFLKGETLEDRIAQGPLPIKVALDIARQVAEGLQAAHAEGIVHRDIKPANIIVSPDGRPTIMDFGLARLTEASRLTKVDTAMGTVAYMSPEQAQGMEVDHRSDVWALGCVLYEMVSGQRTFKGQYDQALLYEIVHEEPEPLTGVRAGVPMELEFIAGKCLAKDASDRYQSAKEIGVDLRTLAEKLKSGRSTILRTAQMTGVVRAAHTLSSAATLPPDAVVVGKRRLWALYSIAAVSAIACLGTLAVLITQIRPDAEREPVRRFSFRPPPGIDTSSRFAGIALSPNGRHIAFTTREALWIQDLDRDQPRSLEGTGGATWHGAMPAETGRHVETVGKVAEGGIRRDDVSHRPGQRPGGRGGRERHEPATDLVQHVVEGRKLPGSGRHLAVDPVQPALHYLVAVPAFWRARSSPRSSAVASAVSRTAPVPSVVSPATATIRWIDDGSVARNHGQSSPAKGSRHGVRADLDRRSGHCRGRGERPRSQRSRRAVAADQPATGADRRAHPEPRRGGSRAAQGRGRGRTPSPPAAWRSG